MRFTKRAGCVIVALLGLASSTLAADGDGKKFLRFNESGDQQTLETSISRFQNKDGVTVDLIGAVHVADASYYRTLNERFKTYDAVLYEMVKPKEMKRVSQRKDSGSWISMFQRFMQTQLDLTFQLDQIDYDAKNFVHADLDAETFAQKQEERGENMLSLMLNSMMREMSKSPEEQTTAAFGIMDLLNAMQSPDRPRQLKLVLAKQFESMDDALDAMGGDDSVILGERNKVALKVLREEIEGGKKNLAIFYGAGHMKGMEELMVSLMGFKPVGEPEWIPAWDMTDADVAPAVIPATQPAGVEPVGAGR